VIDVHVRPAYAAEGDVEPHLPRARGDGFAHTDADGAVTVILG
jgi:hypothetical protein